MQCIDLRQPADYAIGYDSGFFGGIKEDALT